MARQRVDLVAVGTSGTFATGNLFALPAPVIVPAHVYVWRGIGA